MKKRVFVIAAIVSGALAVSGCTTNPYTGEREAGKSGIGAGIGSLSAQASAHSPPPKKIAVKAR
ncbi:outer membrane protein [Salmonella enterica subsp. enterica]|uniref:Outer membrane protein n=1 Tax=Salmonella enterica I TaxID=59201 RepID=A0A379VIN4_SALET|nr:outer membrane protein [Salmonella enterica subsp. enterica]